MAYSWTSSDPLAGIHPRLEPVSAWLFRRGSPFLHTADVTTGAATLFAMAIDADGFRPDLRDAWRALSVPNPDPNDRGPTAAEPFTNAQLDDLLREMRHKIEDPKVFVLPLVARSALSVQRLRERDRLGRARQALPQHPLPVPPTAIVGVIDHGINIFHDRFRHREHGTRVNFAWMQGTARGQGFLPFGREWTQAQIETALASSVGDEESLLRALGTDFARPGFHGLGRRVSHGTHVADLAAGFDPQDPDGDALPIIAVSLPDAVTRETSGSMLALPLALGLEYIADRARKVMQRTQQVVPVVVNVSVGTTGGMRGGRHRLERTVDRIANRHQRIVTRVRRRAGITDPVEAPFTVVFAAGNSNLSQGHARALNGQQELSVGWQLQPADPSANFVEIRLAPETPNVGRLPMVTLSLTPPGEDALEPVTLSSALGRVSQNVQLLERDGAVIGRVSLWRGAGNVTTLTLAIDATDPGGEARTVAPAGEWRIHVTHSSATPHRIDAWVLRDDVPGGFRDTGRQSYFVDPDYITYDAQGRAITEDPADTTSVVRRTGSLNALATETGQGRRLAVGGYVGDGSPLRSAPYSATPLNDAGEKIDISAQSARSLAQPGVLAAGTRSGSRVAISGTSVAAPQVVRQMVTGSPDALALDPPGLRLGAAVLPAAEG
jgi:hypothetical protein